MFPLLETIRFEKGEFNNLEYHLRRMNNSTKTCFAKPLQFDVKNVMVKAQKQMKHKQGLFKFRLLYDAENFQWEFQPYTLPAIKTLKLVYDNNIQYGHKFSDRSRLNNLQKLRGDADDILIVKNGEITDSTFANIIFYDGKQWVTPLNPLLPGTQRAFLIEKNIISEKIITPGDVKQYQSAGLINAMIRFEDKLEVEIFNAATY